LHGHSIFSELALEAFKVLLQLDHAALRLCRTGCRGFFVVDIVQAIQKGVVFKGGL
jgi:hypothetical protein